VHVSSSPAVWYAARASGVAAYVALGIVVSLGLALGGKAQNRRWPRFSVEDVHRFGGLLVGSLIGVHVVAIAADSFLPFSLTQLLVPFTSTYRPLWIGLGIAAAELLAALAITNHYRRRLPYSFWRKAHYLNFAVWGLASLHGLMAGTDRGAVWLAILYGVSVATVLMLLAWRFGRRAFGASSLAAAGAVTAVAVPLLVVGPLRHSPPAWNAARADESLTGSVIRNGSEFQQIVSFVGQARSPQKLLVRADLLVAPEKLEKTSLQLEYLPSGDVCRGRVTRVGGESFTGTCRLANGNHRRIEASWTQNEDGTGVIGEIRLRG
jgi:sulfoxide reductase heme-binding subunit YedZ